MAILLLKMVELALNESECHFTRLTSVWISLNSGLKLTKIASKWVQLGQNGSKMAENRIFLAFFANTSAKQERKIKEYFTKWNTYFAFIA